MAELRCPTCHRRFDSQKTSTLPFCSARCREIDLARWLDERYQLPDFSIEAEEEEGQVDPEEN